MNLLKRLLCRHKYTMVYWRYTHGEYGSHPRFIEAYIKCKKCGKTKLVTAEKGSKFERICKIEYADKER